MNAAILDNTSASAMAAMAAMEDSTKKAYLAEVTLERKPDKPDADSALLPPGWSLLPQHKDPVNRDLSVVAFKRGEHPGFLDALAMLAELNRFVLSLDLKVARIRLLEETGPENEQSKFSGPFAYFEIRSHFRVEKNDEIHETLDYLRYVLDLGVTLTLSEPGCFKVETQTGPINHVAPLSTFVARKEELEETAERFGFIGPIISTGFVCRLDTCRSFSMFLRCSEQEF